MSADGRGGGGGSWGRVLLMLVGTAAVTIGTIAVAGPEPWKKKLNEFWTTWLSPRRDQSTYAAVAKDEDPAASLSPEKPSSELPPHKSSEDPGLGSEWEGAPDNGPSQTSDLVPPPLERRPLRRLPDVSVEEPVQTDLVESDAVESDPVESAPIQLTQVEEEVPIPIVDKPARPLPDEEPEPLPTTTPPVRKTAPMKPAPMTEIAEPVETVSGRLGLRENLSPITAIEDKAAKAKPLLERNAIDKAQAMGDHPTALRELSRWYWRHPDLRPDLHPQLEELARVVYFSPRPHFYEPYVIQPNDRLQTVARKYQVPWEYLCRVNNVNAKKIRAGQKLKVVDGPFSAFISLSNYELIVHHKGAFVRWYPVGVGKDGSSPTGSFTVKDKLVNPTYYGDDGLMKADDPRNPLGERWIDIGDSFGIHGTIDPDSIGKNESRGCIRLLNEDVEELYDLLSVGSPVVIHR